MDRGAWWATVHGAEKSQTQLSTQGQQHLRIISDNLTLSHACRRKIVRMWIFYPFSKYVLKDTV